MPISVRVWAMQATVFSAQNNPVPNHKKPPLFHRFSRIERRSFCAASALNLYFYLLYYLYSAAGKLLCSSLLWFSLALDRLFCLCLNGFSFASLFSFTITFPDSCKWNLPLHSLLHWKEDIQRCFFRYGTRIYTLLQPTSTQSPKIAPNFLNPVVTSPSSA